MILLDTHTLIWLDEGSKKLGIKSRLLLDHALKDRQLFVSTISFWEVAMLIEKKRLSLSIDVYQWRQSLLKNGLNEVQLTGIIAMEAAKLKDFHGDPADRIIVATALNQGATLCTADKKILSWEHQLQHYDASK